MNASILSHTKQLLLKYTSISGRLDQHSHALYTKWSDILLQQPSTLGKLGAPPDVGQIHQSMQGLEHASRYQMGVLRREAINI
jgi:hypothetical protein